jgi:hypothetical protein
VRRGAGAGEGRGAPPERLALPLCRARTPLARLAQSEFDVLVASNRLEEKFEKLDELLTAHATMADRGVRRPRPASGDAARAIREQAVQARREEVHALEKYLAELHSANAALRADVDRLHAATDAARSSVHRHLADMGRVADVADSIARAGDKD